MVVNFSDEARYCKVEKVDVLLPPHAVLVAKGKDGHPRVLPLNMEADNVFRVLVEDTTTGEWLFTNRDDKPMKAIKKGFIAACIRAEIDDLRPYDLRHTFATRLVERGVHHFVISALLGHATPFSGFGYASRITPSSRLTSVRSTSRPVIRTIGNWTLPSITNLGSAAY